LKGLPNRLRADGIEQAQTDQFIREQLQGPVAATFGWVATGQADQGLLDIAFDLDLGRACRLWLVVESGQEAFGDEAFPNASNGPQADGGQIGDVVVVVAIVGAEQDTGVGDLACGDLALTQQGLESHPFVRRQTHPIFVHRCTRLLASVAPWFRE